uniref:t-SNARE coiled-coil homology domain-containing protein n=1 Tax=Ditylum brightwellii TaxID=49249 RepID=A0A7S4RK97_9STRA|mmetsp:Transcript_22477/g.33704  ORF Transcript_22477/g.33704 Transcript_22477/m.33704 type:complete len:974 (+) Transcript_22477:146-3067(+)
MFKPKKKDKGVTDYSETLWTMPEIKGPPSPPPASAFKQKALGGSALRKSTNPFDDSDDDDDGDVLGDLNDNDDGTTKVTQRSIVTDSEGDDDVPKIASKFTAPKPAPKPAPKVTTTPKPAPKVTTKPKPAPPKVAPKPAPKVAPPKQQSQPPPPSIPPKSPLNPIKDKNLFPSLDTISKQPLPQSQQTQRKLNHTQQQQNQQREELLHQQRQQVQKQKEEEHLQAKREEEYRQVQNQLSETIQTSHNTCALLDSQNEQLLHTATLVEHTGDVVNQSRRLLKGMTWSGWMANKLQNNNSNNTTVTRSNSGTAATAAASAGNSGADESDVTNVTNGGNTLGSLLGFSDALPYIPAPRIDYTKYLPQQQQQQQRQQSISNIGKNNSGNNNNIIISSIKKIPPPPPKATTKSLKLLHAAIHHAYNYRQHVTQVLPLCSSLMELQTCSEACTSVRKGTLEVLQQYQQASSRQEAEIKKKQDEEDETRSSLTWSQRQERRQERQEIIKKQKEEKRLYSDIMKELNIVEDTQIKMEKYLKQKIASIVKNRASFVAASSSTNASTMKKSRNGMSASFSSSTSKPSPMMQRAASLSSPSPILQRSASLSAHSSPLSSHGTLQRSTSLTSASLPKSFNSFSSSNKVMQSSNRKSTPMTAPDGAVLPSALQQELEELYADGIQEREEEEEEDEVYHSQQQQQSQRENNPFYKASKRSLQRAELFGPKNNNSNNNHDKNYNNPFDNAIVNKEQINQEKLKNQDEHLAILSEGINELQNVNSVINVSITQQNALLDTISHDADLFRHDMKVLVRKADRMTTGMSWSRSVKKPFYQYSISIKHIPTGKYLTTHTTTNSSNKGVLYLSSRLHPFGSVFELYKKGSERQKRLKSSILTGNDDNDEDNVAQDYGSGAIVGMKNKRNGKWIGLAFWNGGGKKVVCYADRFGKREEWEVSLFSFLWGGGGGDYSGKVYVSMCDFLHLVGLKD